MSDSTWTGPVQSENGFIPVYRDPNSGELIPTAFEIGIGKGVGNNVTPNAGQDNASLADAATVFSLLTGEDSPLGPGIPALATNIFVDKVGGIITTNILLDLNGGYVNKSTTIDSVIAGDNNLYGMLSIFNRPQYGVSTKIEMACIETPAGGTPFINLVCSNGIYQSGVPIGGPTLLIKGNNWTEGNDGRSNGMPQFIGAKPFLYLSTGVAPAAAAAYTAGKFQITITSMNVDYANAITRQKGVDLPSNIHIE